MPETKKPEPQPQETPKPSLQDRRIKALETILAAHNIDTSRLTEQALNAIPETNGELGEFEYQAPQVRPQTQVSERATPEDKASLLLTDIAGMSEAQINSRWEEISPLLQINEGSAV